jgi:hypothetical protein
MTRLAAACLALFGWAAGAAANDSTAELSAGGLVLSSSAEIRMVSEDLYVSAREIRVAYRFLNTAPRDVSTVVAFPLPDLTGAPDANISLPDAESDNFVGFATRVNGAPVATEVERRVVAAGIDRTDRLRQLGIPLHPLARETQQALDALPRERWTDLVALGLVEIESFDETGGGMKDHAVPRWTLKTTYHWRQTFPAGREITVEHSYRPVVGYSAVTPLAVPAFRREADFARYQASYCMDAAFLAAAGRVANSHPQEARIAYVLKTGANWAGPIGDFRLVVDKGHPSNLVSFCGEGVRKTSPTRFEIRQRNFTPTQDLAILIIGRELAP